MSYRELVDRKNAIRRKLFAFSTTEEEKSKLLVMLSDVESEIDQLRESFEMVGMFPNFGGK